jgi:hypothetical protein
MTLAEGAKGFEKFIETVKDLPAWLISALAVAAAILLFEPSINAELPKTYRPWLVVAFVVFGVLALFKWASVAISALRASRVAAKARKTFHVTPIAKHCHWSSSKQADGSIVTQISAHFSVKNQSAGPIGLTNARVISPKIRGEVVEDMVTVRAQHSRMYGSARTSDYRIEPATTLPAHVLVMIRGVPRVDEDRDLKVTLAISDEDGNEQRVCVVCKGVPKPNQGNKPVPLEALHKISDSIEKDVAAVLQEEMNRYEKNGRDGGGLGSVHLLYHNRVMQSFTGDSWTPHSPANQEVAADPEHATLRSDNLDALNAVFARLSTDQERERFTNVLLDRLNEDKGYARIAYLIVCMLWQIELLEEALEAAKFGLQENDMKTYGLSNVLMMFNGLLRYRHPDFSDQMLDMLERFLQGSDEHSFRIPQKIAAIRSRRLVAMAQSTGD